MPYVRFESATPNERGAPVLARVPGFLGLLDRHGVPWRESRSTDPGRIVHEDPHQILVTPP